MVFLLFPEWLQGACRDAKKGLAQTIWARAIARIFLGAGLDRVLVDDRYVWVLRIQGILALVVFAGGLAGIYCIAMGMAR